MEKVKLSQIPNGHQLAVGIDSGGDKCGMDLLSLQSIRSNAANEMALFRVGREAPNHNQIRNSRAFWAWILRSGSVRLSLRFAPNR